METRASIAGHPLHPMAITLPIGLWLFSFICDVVYAFGGSEAWATVAFYNIAGGLAGALLAAIPGVIDLGGIKEPRLKSIGLKHMAINLAVIALFAISLGIRTPDIGAPPVMAMILSLIAILMLGVSGWLGAELVHVHGVSVASNAQTAHQRDGAGGVAPPPGSPPAAASGPRAAPGSGRQPRPGVSRT